MGAQLWLPEMTTHWAQNSTALPRWSQLEDNEKLWFLWGQRPASHLTYTMAQTKANDPPGKTQSPNALLYPEILLCFRLSAEWGCNTRVQGCWYPVHKQDWWGKERKGGKKVPFGNYSLRVNPCLSAQPAPQTPKHVHLKLCAANKCQYCLFVLFSKILPTILPLPTSLEGWEWCQQRQPQQAGVNVQ